MNTRTKALAALFGTVVLWSFMVVVARDAVSRTDSIVLLFLRLFVAFIAFLPIFLKSRVWKKPKFKTLVLVSLASTVNLTFFMLGIAHTSASASQVIYAAIPIIVLLFGTYFQKHSHTARKIAGVIIGFLGIALIVYLSALEKGETIVGSLYGNSLVIIAMLGWASYLLSSKHLTKFFAPVEIGSTTITVGFLVSSVLLAIHLLGGADVGSLALPALAASIYMGLFGTFTTYILYQYAVKHLSSLTVSLTSYIQPITTAFLAILFLGERLTTPFIIGSILVFAGIFLVSEVKLITNSSKGQSAFGRNH